MPIVESSYQPPLLFRNRHFSTIYSSKIRTAPEVKQIRERVILEDTDFIDLDWSYTRGETEKLVILLHGLEGNASRPYMKGIASHLNNNGWDVAAVNFRGCSGEPNRLYQSYTAGSTQDLEEVIQHIRQKEKYKTIALNGFSLGGNLLLKYLGERENIHPEIKKAVVISTPLSLEDSLEELNKKLNIIYSTVFLRSLKKKYLEKVNQFPEKASREELKRIKSLKDFDTVYTSKAYGFKDAYEYYLKNSSLQFLPQIKIPVFILNAVDDSFLSPSCYPYEIAENSKNIYLEAPRYGGHVGFYEKGNIYYNEHRTLHFLEGKI